MTIKSSSLSFRCVTLTSRRYLVLAACVSLGLAAPAQARLPRYYVQVRDVGSDKKIISALEARSGRIAWTRRCENVWHWDLSKDRRSIAVLMVGDSGNELLLWHAGERVQEIEHLPLDRKQSKLYDRKDALDSDIMMNVKWAPDASRLLIMSSRSMGAASVDQGTLWCLTVATRRLQLVDIGCIDDACWLRNRSVRYTRVRYSGDVYSPERTIRHLAIVK